jgi:hypothetical protein
MSTSPINIEFFTNPPSDYEVSQYRVLGALKKITKDFQDNKIYPHLSNLIKLYRSMKEILKSLQELRSEFPKRIKKIDFVNQEIEHEVVFESLSDLTKVEDLIEWGMPLIQEKIEEGTAIYEFVNDEIKLEQVGIIPDYTDEGYFFVPDNEESKLLLFEYEVSVFESPTDTYRSLKTSFMKVLRHRGAHRSPNAIKLDLINENKKLPNPATFLFDTDLFFPFRETIFPITKRKLLRQLSD